MKQKYIKWLIIAVVLVLAVTASIIGIRVIKANNILADSDVEALLMKTAEDINDTCPFMVDDSTRLDEVSAGPGHLLTYRYTIMNVNKDDLDTHVFHTLMEESLIDYIKNDEGMEYLRSKEVEFRYIYYDRKVELIGEIIIAPEEYLDKLE